MKKFGLILISIFTLCIGGLLSACTFKTVSASFSQEEVLLSPDNGSVALDNYLTVDGAEKKEIEYKVTNADLFDVQGSGRVLVAKESFGSALKIDFIVSFLMESGVKMLLPDLREAVSRGVKIRILTGRYLGITQPSALYLLRKEFGNEIDLRFYYTTEHSFHPKAYFFLVHLIFLAVP